MYIFVLMDKQDEYAYYLNLAGRQRMLSQQIQSYALQSSFQTLAQADLQALSEVQTAFDAALNILIQPNSFNLFDRHYAPIVEKLYFDSRSGISALVHRYFSLLEKVKNAESKVDFLQLKQVHSELLTNLELAVSLIEQ